MPQWIAVEERDREVRLCRLWQLLPPEACPALAESEQPALYWAQILLTLIPHDHPDAGVLAWWLEQTEAAEAQWRHAREQAARARHASLEVAPIEIEHTQGALAL